MPGSSLHSYLRHSFGKNRLYTFINVIGLAIAFACLFLVSFFVYDEYSFDRYHKNAKRIYRVVLDFDSDGTVTQWAKTSAPIGKYLSGAFSEVEQVVRIRKNPGTDLLSYGDEKFYEDRIFFSDSSLFRVFDFEVVQGDIADPLSNKNSIVLSEKLAVKLFGNIDVLGKVVGFNNQVDLNITAVMENMPANSHFVADAFISFTSLDELLGEKRLAHWGQFDHYTYVLLTPGSSPEQLESKFPELLKKNAPEWVAEKETLYLQAINSIHLHSDRKDEININSKEAHSYVLATISLFILFMACANFINISTATLTARYKEITIRKILGANRVTLSVVLFSEVFAICGIALFISFILAYVFIPHFNLVTSKQIIFFGSYIPFVIVFIATVGIATISGFFSAFKSFRLNESKINRITSYGINRSAFRSSLVGFQFLVSIFLIICTWIVSKQNNYLHALQLGFDSENVLVIPIKDRSKNDRSEVIVDEMLKVPGVENVGFSSSTPGTNNSLTYTYSFPGSENGEQAISTFLIDPNFFDLYKVGIAAGRILRYNPKDTIAEIMVNEAAVKAFNLKDPIGQVVTGKVEGRIVGVVEDFNYSSLHQTVGPLILYSFPPTFRYVSIRLNKDGPNESVSLLDKRWRGFFPGFPMEYAFLNDQNAELYRSERVQTKLYAAFSWVAILIAGVGLVGLAAYSLERKKKEISIRKVFGATEVKIVQLIYSTYIPVILVSSLIAWVFAYHWMRRWLSEFANKIDFEAAHFIFPTLIMIGVLLVTTGLQSLYASLRNPIDNLRQD